MIERVINLYTIEPIEFFGVNNAKFDIIVKQFPKLKLIARGDNIKVIGEDKEILRFEKKINQLLEFYDKYNHLSVERIEQILAGKSDNDFKKAGEEEVILFGNRGQVITPRTPNQRVMVKEDKKSDLMFAIGPAGTGKTYVAVALAVKALKNREVKRIILSRPAVEAGEQLGFLPGDLKEKLDPYLQPLYDALFDMIPYKKLTEYFEEKIIEIAPLAFMRGRTLDNAYVILDEAQNATKSQIKMFLTRMGENAKFIVTGDITQIDLPKKYNSGLIKALNILTGVKGISITYFDEKDIVRHKLVKKIVQAYDKDDALEKDNDINNNRNNN